MLSRKAANRGHTSGCAGSRWRKARTADGQAIAIRATTMLATIPSQIRRLNQTSAGALARVARVAPLPSSSDRAMVPPLESQQIGEQIGPFLVRQLGAIVVTLVAVAGQARVEADSFRTRLRRVA